MAHIVSRHPDRSIQFVVAGLLCLPACVYWLFYAGMGSYLGIGGFEIMGLVWPMVPTAVLVLFLGLNIRPEMELQRAFAAQNQAFQSDPNVETMTVRGWWPTNSAILKQLQSSKNLCGDSPTFVIVGLSPLLPSPTDFRDEPRSYRIGSYAATVMLLVGLCACVALLKWVGVGNYEWWVISRVFDLAVCLTAGYLILHVIRPKKYLRISPGLFEVVKPPPLFGSNEDRILPIKPPQTVILRVMSPPGGMRRWLKLGFSPSITIFDGTTETNTPAVETNIPTTEEALEHLLNTLTSTVVPAVPK